MKTMYVIEKGDYMPSSIAVCDTKEDAIKAYELLVGPFRDQDEDTKIREVLYIGGDNANQD